MTRPTTDQADVRCGGPGDALDAIPYLLGFAPTESLVMLCLSGPRCRFGPVVRFDLPEPDRHLSLVTEALELFTLRTSCDQVLFIVYTDEGSSDPLSLLPRQDLLLEARQQFRAAGLGLKDAVVVRHGRWWSLLCDDPLCCPPEGTPVEHDTPSAVALAYLAAGAKPPAANRDAILDSLRHRPDAAVDAELERLVSGASGLRTDALVTQLQEVVAHAMARGPGRLEPAAVSLLIFLVQNVQVRDEATQIPFHDELPAAIELWREVYTACPDTFRPHVGAIIAVLAWEAGGGALATCACQSVLEVDPEHNLTLLTLSLIENAIRPEPRVTRAQHAADQRAAMRALRRQQHARRSTPSRSAGRRGR